MLVIPENIEVVIRPHRPAVGLLLVLVVGMVLLVVVHGHWMFAPNDVYLNGSPEGISQYANTAWHVVRDTTPVHFGGQNYPFGEHIAYTDNMACISGVLQYLHQRGLVDLRGRTAGVLNVFLLFTILLGAVFLYWVFYRLHMPVWVSVWGALAIVFLSPQHIHFGGQIALASPVFIPALLWLTVVLEGYMVRRYVSLVIGLLVWFSAQLNEFYFWLSGLFLFGYMLWHWLRHPGWLRFYSRAVYLVAMLLLPYVLLNIWHHWSDFAVDRPRELEAFWLNRSSLAGLFLPPDYVRHVGAVPQSYLGLTAGLFTLWMLLRLFRPFPKPWREDFIHRLNKPFLYAALFSGFLLLLLSLDVASIPGLQWLWRLPGPLRGLRQPAHLAWVYFYVANMVAVYGCWKTAVHLPARFHRFRLPLMLFPLLLLSAEAVLWQRWVRVDPVPNPELSRPGVDPELLKGHQAMLSIPYYHASPADTSAQPEARFYSSVRRLSLATGIPEMGVYQFKPSRSEMLLLLQLNGAPCDPPFILNELPDETPLLLVVDERRLADWQQRVPHLLRAARPLANDGILRLFSLAPDSIRSVTQLERNKIIAESKSLRSTKSAWYGAQPEPPVAYESFNSLTGGRSFQGAGAARGRLHLPLVLWEGHPGAGTYVVSFWVYANSDQGLHHHLRIRQDDEKKQEHTLLPFVRAVVNDWALIEIPFTVSEQVHRYTIDLYRPDSGLPFEVDELLIYRAGNNYYREEPGWIVKNNYWYRRF